MSDDTTAFAQGPMGAAADLLHQLATYIVGELDTMLAQARKWEAASSGATKMQAQEAIRVIQEHQHDISAFSTAYGTQVSNSASEMMALDRRLAANINVG